MVNLRDLCLRFLAEDEDAQLWGQHPDDFSDAPDCDVMTKRFAQFATAEGLPADVVRVELNAPLDTMGGGPHWFAVINGVAFDWTARQFYDVHGVNFAYDEIPQPLLFLWPGPYPLPGIDIDIEED